MMSNSTTTSTLRPDAGSPLHSRAHQDRCRRWHRPKCLSGPQPDPLSAVGAGAIKINPAAGVRLPRSERGEMVFLTPGQVHDLAAELSENDGLLVTFAAYTGLRAAEIAGLRVGRVDLGRRVVDVVETIGEANGRLVSGPTKTHERRTVPLPRSSPKNWGGSWNRDRPVPIPSSSPRQRVGRFATTTSTGVTSSQRSGAPDCRRRRDFTTFDIRALRCS